MLALPFVTLHQILICIVASFLLCFKMTAMSLRCRKTKTFHNTSLDFMTVEVLQFLSIHTTRILKITHTHHKLATAFHTFISSCFFVGLALVAAMIGPCNNLSENTFTDDQLRSANFGSFCDIMQFTIAHLVTVWRRQKKNHS